MAKGYAGEHARTHAQTQTHTHTRTHTHTSSTFGWAHVAALYFGPLAFTNCWLVLYTWLQVGTCLTAKSSAHVCPGVPRSIPPLASSASWRERYQTRGAGGG